MTRSRSMWWAAAAILISVLAVRGTLAGQAAAEPSQDTLAALLVEVRGLRAAMEQMASVGPSIQLAMGRLQLQEQRINTLVRRADGCMKRSPPRRNEPASCKTAWEILNENWSATLNLNTGQRFRPFCQSSSRS